MSDSRIAPPNPAIAVFCRRRPPRGEKVTRGVELWTEDSPATVGGQERDGGLLFVLCRTGGKITFRVSAALITPTP